MKGWREGAHIDTATSAEMGSGAPEAGAPAESCRLKSDGKEWRIATTPEETEPDERLDGFASPAARHRDLEFRSGTSYRHAKEWFELSDAAVFEWEPAPALGALIHNWTMWFARRRLACVNAVRNEGR